MVIFSILPISLQQGLAYALVALGIALTFRVLAFPDLTVDGSFPLGGAVVARLIVAGLDPALAVVAAGLSGCQEEQLKAQVVDLQTRLRYAEAEKVDLNNKLTEADAKNTELQDDVSAAKA